MLHLPIAEFFSLVVAASVTAGFLGALVGLGGGTFLVPIYTLFLGIPIAYAHRRLTHINYCHLQRLRERLH